MLSRVLCLVALATASASFAGDPWLTFEAGEGVGNGKKVVFVTGDEEYRSEESMPMFAELLAKKHGFNTQVLFAINKETGEIDPEQTDNIVGLEALRDADLMVLFIRWRNIPDEQTKEILDYTMSGRPVMAIRTATHPFYWRKGEESAYRDKWNWNEGKTGGGYGREILGATWVSHYGKHNKESTLLLPAYQMSKHPVTSGVTEAWDAGDVYGIETPPGSINPIYLGVVLDGMTADSPARADKELLPVVWHKEYLNEAGNTNQVITTTLGTAEGFQNEGFRRIMVNSVCWLTGSEVLEKADVTPVRPFEPLPSGFGGHRKGVFVDDLR